MKRHALPEAAISRARSLRRDATPQEKTLWRALKESFPQVKLRRQVPMGPYIADFVCHSAHLIIELDGGQHAEQQGYDAVRSAFLEGEGYRVLRFWNNDVDDHLEGVITKIAEFLTKQEVAA